MLARRHMCGLAVALFGVSALSLGQVTGPGKGAEAIMQARELLRAAWRQSLSWDKAAPQVDAHFERIAKLPAEDLQDLCLDGGLAPLDAEILSIALFCHRSPELLHRVRKTVADSFAEQTRRGRWPARVPADLQTEAYRLAWEYLLLKPDDSRLFDMTVITAARALGAIGDPRALPVLEASYVWSAKNPRFWKALASVTHILAGFGRDPAAKREALLTAWRCYDATADREEKEARLELLKAGGCDPEIVKQELGQANKYRKFLELLLLPDEG